MDECPVCLEPLLGTVVHLECCKKHVHIQCYLPKCPMCRAELPAPPLSPNQVIIPIPVPVPVQQTNPQFLLKVCIFITTATITGLLVFYPPH